MSSMDRDSLRSIRLLFDLETSASAEDVAALIATTEQYCVVLQTISGGVPVTCEGVAR